MARLKTALILAFLILLTSGALAGVDIAFTPDDSVAVDEGGNETVTVTLNDTDVDTPPIVIVIDSTAFTAASYDTTDTAGDSSIVVTLDITPGYSDAGNYGIDIRAIDSNSNVVDTTLIVNVVDVDRPPQFVNLPDSITINEGQSTSFSVVAGDLDGDAITLEISTATDTVTWVSIPDPNGPSSDIEISTVPFTVATWQNTPAERVFDILAIAAGDTATETFKIKVANVDRPPVFTQPSRDTVIVINQYAAGSLTFRATEPDAAEGDSVLFFDMDGLVADLTGLGWTVSFADSVLDFTAPGDSVGLADPAGWRFLAAREAGAPGDTVVVNFDVRDNAAPEAVTGLTADSSGMAFGNIELSWTAPHEDGTSGGSVRSYYVRYATSAPGGDPDAWWNAAQNVGQQPPAPQAPGQTETLIVEDLVEYQDYWYGIKSDDASGNLSALAIAGPFMARTKPPSISFIGDAPDTVKLDSLLLFNGVGADSGGILSAIKYSTDGSSWTNVTIDSTADSSFAFIRKYFHFSQNSGSNPSLTIYVRAFDLEDSSTIQQNIVIDNVPPNMPTVTSAPPDTTSDNSFDFEGTRDADANVWAIVKIGSSPGTLLPTQPGAEDTLWTFSENIYYQGNVRFSFFALDNAGNSSDTLDLDFLLLPESPNIIDPDGVIYHNSNIYNPQSDSFAVTFDINQDAYFVMVISNQLGAAVYNWTDSLTAGTYTYGWHGQINTGPDAGQIAGDGRYLVRYSARIYPVSPYNIPLEAELVLDSYAPYEMSFFPNSGSNGEQTRIIGPAAKFVLVVGDTGAVGTNATADIMTPLLTYGAADTITFAEIDSIPGQWEANLTSSPLSVGTYEMTLIITDEAGNQNSYPKYYQVTEDTGITGFLNYPNPFAPSVEQTQIAYVLGQNATELKLEIYDTSGDLVYMEALDGAYLDQGEHEYRWDGRSAWGRTLNNGVYFARLTGSLTTEFLKIAIIDR